MFVVKRANQDVSAEELREFLSHVVAKWWLPEEFVFIEALPYNSNGKVRKDALRELHRNGLTEKTV